jgi:hypothetical protein
MGEKAVKTVFAVSHIEVDTRVDASLNMYFSAFGLAVGTWRPSLAFGDCEVLVSTEIFDNFKFVFEPLVFQELFVVHKLNNLYENSEYNNCVISIYLKYGFQSTHLSIELNKQLFLVNSSTMLSFN